MLFACINGIYRFKKLDISSTIIAVLVCCAFINEGAAYYMARRYHNNLLLYAIYSFFEFGFLCLYFNTVIDVFARKNIGIYNGLIGILFGILNLIFVQKSGSLNSYYLFLESLGIVGMSLFAFFRMLLKNESLRLPGYVHFWFTSIIIFFWSITFLYWGLLDYFTHELKHNVWEIYVAELVIGIITYTGFGCVFLFYPKMKETNE